MKLEQAFHIHEGRRMTTEDRFGCVARLVSSRTAAKFRMGQSVLHFWAGWMATATEPPSSFNKKNRPKWFSAEILAEPTVLAQGAKYGGVPVTGWGYKVF
jgi:uncharacterized membrane protein YhdT